MNFVAVFMSVFAMLGALDRILGNKFGIGKEFERGFFLFGNMALSMMGMIIIAPLIADLLSPVFDFTYNVLHLDASIIPASLFANDMGGAPLAVEVAQDPKLGMFNALVVSAMMGVTISFTIPYALETVGKEHHKEVLIGFLCGIVTVPIGCFVGGIASKIPLGALLLDLLPLIIFSGLIATGLALCPMICVKIFGIFGTFMKILITVGLALGILKFLTGVEVFKNLETLEAAADVCVNASTVMSGAFPFVFIISKLLTKPMIKFGNKLGINETAALGFVSSLATSVTTYEMMSKMDKKGIILNAAFTISAAFTFAGHLAFTLAFDADYIFPMIIGKLVAGISAVVLAIVMYKRLVKQDDNAAETV